MFERYTRQVFLLLVCHIFVFGFLYGFTENRLFAGLVYGSFVLTLNFFLSAFIFAGGFSNSRESLTDFSSPPVRKGIFNRLALLLALSVKGVNLLFLTYLGIKFLDLNVFFIVLGALLALVAQVFILWRSWEISHSKA